MMAANRGGNLCNVCIDETPNGSQLKLCSRCNGGAKYCNSGCQKKDWPIHKIFCNLPAPDSAPHENTVQALYFPEDSNGPILVHVKVGRNINGGLDASQYLPGTLGVDVKCYSNEDFPQYQGGHEKLGYRLDCGYSFYYCVNSDHLTENQCMKRVLTGHARAQFGGNIAQMLGPDFWRTTLEKQKKWRGPLLLVKTDRCRKDGSPAPTYRDFEHSDVKYAVLYLAFLSNILGPCVRY